MKKVVKLTESQLISLVKKVIKEQGEMASKSNEFIGKTVTLYTSKEDAVAAANSGKSNPRSKGAEIGVIVNIEKITNEGLVLIINFTNLSDEGKKNLSSGGTLVDYDRQAGTFDVRAFDGSVYYSESLKRALDKKYYTTDFASKQSPNGSQANMA
jgi:hypothetical protein